MMDQVKVGYSFSFLWCSAVENILLLWLNKKNCSIKAHEISLCVWPPFKFVSRRNPTELGLYPTGLVKDPDQDSVVMLLSFHSCRVVTKR